jgi:hypothetical protein
MKSFLLISLIVPVVGEGERPLLKLVQNISNGKKLDDVPYLIYPFKGKYGQMKVFTARGYELIANSCFEECRWILI